MNQDPEGFFKSSTPYYEAERRPLPFHSSILVPTPRYRVPAALDQLPAPKYWKGKTRIKMSWVGKPQLRTHRDSVRVSSPEWPTPLAAKLPRGDPPRGAMRPGRPPPPKPCLQSRDLISRPRTESKSGLETMRTPISLQPPT